MYLHIYIYYICAHCLCIDIFVAVACLASGIIHLHLKTPHWWPPQNWSLGPWAKRKPSIWFIGVSQIDNYVRCVHTYYIIISVLSWIVCMYMCIWTCIYIYIHIYIYTCVYIYICLHMCIYIYMIIYVYTHIRFCLHVYAPWYILYVRYDVFCHLGCMYILINMCIYIYIHIYTCLHTYIYIYHTWCCACVFCMYRLIWSNMLIAGYCLIRLGNIDTQIPVVFDSGPASVPLRGSWNARNSWWCSTHALSISF